MIFFKLIVTNLLRHRIRSLISIAGIAFSVAAMLTVVTILQGAIGMFSGILSSDSEIIVFERNVSDLFFSNVPAAAVEEIAALADGGTCRSGALRHRLQRRSSHHHLLRRHRCRRAHSQGRLDCGRSLATLRSTPMMWFSASGPRSFSAQSSAIMCPSATGSFTSSEF